MMTCICRLCCRPVAGRRARGASAAQLAASSQPRIEAFQYFRVELGGGQRAERGPDVDPDQIEVAVACCLGELRDVEPLVDRLADRDLCLGVPLVVDLSFQLRESTSAAA